MEKKINYLILNNKNIGISKIELNKDELNVTDKRGKYTFHITLTYDWKKINQVKVGNEENLSFNEYYLSENNEAVLIWPDICKLKKIKDDYIAFNLEFLDIDNNKDTCYMNKRKCFDIPLHNLKVVVYIDYKDVTERKIIYLFKDNDGNGQ